MSKKCEICGKTTGFGNNVSFSMRHSKRTWKPNIRRVKASINGGVKRINICTKCLKSGRIERAL